MTREDYEKVAAALKMDETLTATQKKIHRAIVMAAADKFAETDSSFDFEAFRRTALG